jgi:CRISPR-associated endonuclease/helicase Cas3
MDIDLKHKYKSHPDKLLFDHLTSVAEKACMRWNSKIVEVISFFHDLGKINPNFQNKLQGKETGYSNHAYLSAVTWMIFCAKNPEIVKKWKDINKEDIFAIATIIAKHHGNLTDMNKGFFLEEPRDELKFFLFSKPEIPISEFLQFLIIHKDFVFDLSNLEADYYFNRTQTLFYARLKTKIQNPLYFFHNTQFGFACLIEADKRDAGDSNDYQRLIIGNQLREIYGQRLHEELNQYKKDSALNCLRTEMRNEALESIKSKLENGERVFTLTSPTGSGKTMMLLALANEIIRRNPEHDLLYALPFLSITEQVEAIAKKVFGENLVLRVDSKSENKELQKLLEESDNEPEKIQELLCRVFSNETFDHPFIITTFVRFFETLVSNRNSELLKLPNFSKRIFLIDEVQALPPRLYIFFAALLDEFCIRFDSYAILSTATMPYFEIDAKTDDRISARNLFKNYPKYGEAKNRELLNAKAHFSNDIFNRYTIKHIDNDTFIIDDLVDEIRLQDKSCLIILNTIQDTKDLYEKFQYQPDIYILLNTHFHLEDRKAKIKYCKEKLEAGERVVLISTQLIEAGVDIDFPVLYRDLCPLPSLIQSAGRCNRNGSSEKGKVYFFELRNKSQNKLRADLIYRDEVGKEFLSFCKENIIGEIFEKDLFGIQEKFFKEKVGGLNIGWHFQTGLNNGDNKIEMVECIQNSRFETLGQFKLIDKKVFGEEYRYYVPKDDNDSSFEELMEFQEQVHGRKPFKESKILQLKLEMQLRSMSERVVTVRLSDSQKSLAPQASEEVFGIKKLTQENAYSVKKGIVLTGIENCFI